MTKIVKLKATKSPVGGKSEVNVVAGSKSEQHYRALGYRMPEELPAAKAAPAAPAKAKE